MRPRAYRSPHAAAPAARHAAMAATALISRELFISFLSLKQVMGFHRYRIAVKGAEMSGVDRSLTWPRARLAWPHTSSIESGGGRARSEAQTVAMSGTDMTDQASTIRQSAYGLNPRLRRKCRNETERGVSRDGYRASLCSPAVSHRRAQSVRSIGCCHSLFPVSDGPTHQDHECKSRRCLHP